MTGCGLRLRWLVEAVLLGALVACAAPPLPLGADGRVSRIVDGDTVRVDGTRVRLIGVDAPEVHGPVECHGREATRALAALLPVGTPVRLAYDVERRDRYGRTLAYVYRRRDRLFVNARLVADGHAVPFTVPPNVAHAAEFRRLATAARRRDRGLWATCRGRAGFSAPAHPTPRLSVAALGRRGIAADIERNGFVGVSARLPPRVHVTGCRMS